MGSKIAWRPRVPLWSDGILAPKRRRSGAPLGIAALLCGLVAVSAYSVYLEHAGEPEGGAFAGEQERRGGATAAEAPPSRRPTAEPSGQKQSSRQPDVAPGAAEMAHSIAETTGGAGALLPSPSSADSGAKTAIVDAAPVKTEQPDAAAPKSRAAKKVHRPGRDAFASIGGWNSFWGGNDFGTRPGQPIHAAPGPRQR
jgi:hypothetical protein